MSALCTAEVVTLVDSSGKLRISDVFDGQIDGNHIRITDATVGATPRVLIEGLSGTLVDNLSSRTLSVPSGKISVNLTTSTSVNAGHSVIVLDLDTSFDALSVTATGNESFIIVADSILLRSSDSDIAVGGARHCQLISSGASRDVAASCNFVSSRFSFAGASHPSGNMNIIGGDVDVDGGFASGNLSVKTSIGLVNNTFVYGEIAISTGGGNDEVEVTDVSCERLKASLGSGRDDIRIAGSSADSVYIDGGSGSDIVFDDGGNNFVLNAKNTSSIAIK